MSTVATVSLNSSCSDKIIQLGYARHSLAMNNAKPRCKAAAGGCGCCGCTGCTTGNCGPVATKLLNTFQQLSNLPNLPKLPKPCPPVVPPPCPPAGQPPCPPCPPVGTFAPINNNPVCPPVPVIPTTSFCTNDTMSTEGVQCKTRCKEKLYKRMLLEQQKEEAKREKKCKRLELDYIKREKERKKQQSKADRKMRMEEEKHRRALEKLQLQEELLTLQRRKLYQELCSKRNTYASQPPPPPLPSVCPPPCAPMPARSDCPPPYVAYPNAATCLSLSRYSSPNTGSSCSCTSCHCSTSEASAAVTNAPTFPDHPSNYIEVKIQQLERDRLKLVNELIPLEEDLKRTEDLLNKGKKSCADDARSRRPDIGLEM